MIVNTRLRRERCVVCRGEGREEGESEEGRGRR